MVSQKKSGSSISSESGDWRQAGFWMNGRVSSQNVRKYAPKGNNPEFTYEVSASKLELMVWMGVCGNGTVLGPFFFDGNVNGAKYLEMLIEEVFPANYRCIRSSVCQRKLFSSVVGPRWCTTTHFRGC